MCRWGVESFLFPELTANLSTGFYTRADIEHIVSFALDRGVRLVPEFDMPGHAAGLLPLQVRGVEFCNAPGASKIPNWCTLNGANGSVAQKVGPSTACLALHIFAFKI
jgi:hypothetical protein